MRMSYERAVAWIALNDETAATTAEEMEDLISVVLVADLTGKAAHRVARDVVNRRLRKA